MPKKTIKLKLKKIRKNPVPVAVSTKIPIKTYDKFPGKDVQHLYFYIPDNDVIKEQEVYIHIKDIKNLLRNYKKNPKAIEFIADMM